MPILEDHHDLAHPVEGDEAWSESYYFNAYHPASDSGFYTRIGVRPNEGTIDVGFTAWLPGNRVAMHRAVREQREMVDRDLEVGGVRYRMVEAAKQWRLTAEAEVHRITIGRGAETVETVPLGLDVTFSALTPPIGGDGQGKEGQGSAARTRQSVGKGHLEQAGRWTGWLQVGEERWEWPEGAEGDQVCRGNRDKSWGPRRWGGPRMWRWFSINLGDDVHFGGIRIGTDDGDLHRGWVWKDGRSSSIREWKVTTELHDDDLTHKVTNVVATDADGRTHELRAEVMRVHGIPAGARSTTVVGEGLARWHHEGIVGYGISEYLHQLDDDGRPVVPIE